MEAPARGASSGGSKPSANEFSALLRGSTIGAVTLCVLGTPLDVARHASQAALSRSSQPGFTEALRAAASPSFRGLWRGLAPALCCSALAPATFLVAYEFQRGSTEAIEAGMVARAVQVIVTQPFSFLQTCRQATALLPGEKGAHLSRGTWEIMVEDGPRTLWRGLLPVLLRDVAASGIFWWSYLKLGDAILPPRDRIEEEFNPKAAQQRAMAAAGIGSVCAVTAAIATQPFDVVKTKMQIHQMMHTNRDGFRRQKVARFLATLKETFKATGWRGLWTGCGPRVVVAAAGGLLLGPIFEFGQLIAGDSVRPLRRPLNLPEDPTHTIVHPRSSKDMYIEVRQ
ncbi:unnamed protein product [Polarella glacialis]|uniref:Mitochondrial carrier protein n=1 Tax=Polarella glacialis TaxID=89957 RepID=A0A813GBW8_POLGL|nr:unnamed protein product [Polarella glacialis]